MLQQFRLTRAILDDWEAAGAFPAPWASMAELEAATNSAVERLYDERDQRASGIGRVRAFLDRALRTDAVEYLDRESVSEADKYREVRALDRVNRAIWAYRRFLRVLAPFIRGAARDRGRPARLLELASGSGEFTLALAEAAQREGLPVEVTGSDIVEYYVDNGNASAQRRGLDVRFRRINAFDMGDVDAGDYDLVFIAQSVHHFSPGQVAMMIAQSRRIAGHGFVAVDGQRALHMLPLTGFVGAVGMAISQRHHMAYDAIVSGRRFYGHAELEIAARSAAPQATITVRNAFPFYTVLTVT